MKPVKANGLSACVIITVGALLVATIAHSQIYVANNAGGTVGVYDLSGAPINTALISGVPDVFGVAVSGGYLYVSYGIGSIGKYTTSGQVVNSKLITGLDLPAGIVVSGNYLYVANGGGLNRVGVYSTDGATVNPSLLPGLANPVGIALTHNTLFVSSWNPNGWVGEYRTDGTTVNERFASGLTNPGGLAVDDAGNVYVGTVFGTIYRYTASGTLIGTFDTGSRLGPALAYANGHLFTVNNYGGPGGNVVDEYTTSGQVVHRALITGLSNPLGIAVVVPEPSVSVLMPFLLGVWLITRDLFSKASNGSCLRAKSILPNS